MLSRDEIVKIISEDKELPKICRKLAKEKSRADDLYQELMLVLLEYNPNRIEEIYNQSSSAFKFFVVRIAMNMAYNKGSKFNRMMNCCTELTTDIAEETHPNREPIFQEVEKTIASIQDEYRSKNKFPYELRMFEQYLKEGSLRRISDKTNIPLKSVFAAVNSIRKKIKSNVRLEDFAH